MDNLEDPFDVLVLDERLDPFDDLKRAPERPSASALAGAATARFQGFALDERPLVGGLPGLPGEVVPAQTTVPLSRSNVGCAVVVVFEGGDVRRPIVLGVLQGPGPAASDATVPRQLAIDMDDDRIVLSAEREIVLRCGDASITLTRAGKVVIRGSYILSRSSGYNKIKGAAVDIN